MLNQNRAEKAPDGRKSKIGERLWTNIWSEAVAVLVIGAAFAAFVWRTCPSQNVPWPLETAVIFMLFFVLAMLLLVFERRFDALELLAVAACVCCALYARVALLPFESGDYKTFLSQWTNTLASMSFRDALSTPIGNYNLPYIYFLAVISRFDIDYLLYIKAFSCLFDVILAYAVMRLARLGVDDRRFELGAFLVVLLSPTVMMNGALWAQCDSVYVAFCVISALAAIQGRGRLCAISWTVAFCFKLQAVFMLPALAVALFMGKVKPKHLLWIPAVYIISLLPALFAGRSIADCVGIYLSQTSEHTALFLNAPSVWALFGDNSIREMRTMALFTSFGVILAFSLCALTVKDKITERGLLTLFFLSSLFVPFMLPKMHDRYFYMAEIFAIVYFMYDRKKWYVPVAVTLSSLNSYMRYFKIHEYLAETGEVASAEYLTQQTGFDTVWFAVVFLVILAVECRGFFKELWSKTPDTYI